MFESPGAAESLQLARDGVRGLIGARVVEFPSLVSRRSALAASRHITDICIDSCLLEATLWPRACLKAAAERKSRVLGSPTSRALEQGIPGVTH